MTSEIIAASIRHPEHVVAAAAIGCEIATVPAKVLHQMLDHPLTGRPVVGLVARGGSRKLANLRARPQATIVVRSGWEWAAAEGRAELAGPGDPLPGIGAEELRLLLRAVFTAAGGTHDDWATYDRVMAAEGRTAVLVEPRRVYPRA